MLELVQVVDFDLHHLADSVGSLLQLTLILLFILQLCVHSLDLTL